MDENRYLEQLWQSLLNSIVILLHGYVIFAVFFHPLYYQSDIRFVYLMYLFILILSAGYALTNWFAS